MSLFGNKRKDYSIQPPKQLIPAGGFSVTDSANINFTYFNSNLTADLTQTGVIAGVYGDADNVPQVTVDAFGRITGVQLVPISKLKLQTNGVDNGDQALLNLVAGTNMTITDDGFGNITFDATGGSGSGTVTSVAATVPTPTNPAFSVNVTNPTTTPSIDITANGTSSQYIDGTGALQTLPPSGGILHGTASGTDTYTVTISGATAYADGDAYLIRFTNGNTTTSTLNINGLGAITLYRNNDGALIGGDIWADAEMLCIYNSTTNAFQCIGTSPNSLFSYVTNDDSVTLTKGMPVYAFSGTGDRLTVKRANNTSDATSAQTIGLVLSTSIAANQKGIIIMQGLLTGLNILPTSTWADGHPVYLGPTAGSITPTKPYAPNHLVYLGFVTTASNGSAGRLYVRVQNGYELDELHNVQAQSPTLNDILYYFGGSPGQWKTAQASTLLPTSFATGSCGVTFDGQGGTIANGKTAYVQIPYDGTLGQWTLVGNTTGSCTVTVFKDTYANYPPTTPTDNIYTVQPSLSSTNKNQNAGSYVGGMSTVTAGDWIGFTISGVSTLSWVNLTISITKT